MCLHCSLFVQLSFVISKVGFVHVGSGFEVCQWFLSNWAFVPFFAVIEKQSTLKDKIESIVENLLWRIGLVAINGVFLTCFYMFD